MSNEMLLLCCKSFTALSACHTCCIRQSCHRSALRVKQQGRHKPVFSCCNTASQLQSQRLFLGLMTNMVQVKPVQYCLASLSNSFEFWKHPHSFKCHWQGSQWQRPFLSVARFELLALSGAMHLPLTSTTIVHMPGLANVVKDISLVAKLL